MGSKTASYRLIITEYCNATPEELAGFTDVSTVLSEEKAITAYNENPADVLIFCYGPGHESCIDTAIYIAEHSAAAVMVMFGDDVPRTQIHKCAESGILYVKRSGMRAMIPALKALRTRLKSYEDRTSSLQRKLDDTRLVNRAKLLLMTRLKMSETEAHRYIEKTAMDTCTKRSEVAESIIRIYEE